MELNTEEILSGAKQLMLKDIKCVVDKGKIDPADYPNMDKAIDMLKDIETIDAMKHSGYFETDEYGISGARMPMYKMSGYDGNSMNSYRNSYDPGYSMNSYERGRSATTGRYVSRDGDPMMELQHMMDSAQTEMERQTIQRLMNKMGR